MKKLTLFCMFCLVSVVGAMAQKSNVKVQYTQARLLDTQSNGYVKPLTVELKVNDGGRVKDQWRIDREDAEAAMNGDITNIRSYAVYLSSQKHDCDVIVAATFNIRTSDDGKYYDVEVVGFPASFVNWKTATQADYEWIRMEKSLTTADRDKIQAVVK